MDGVELKVQLKAEALKRRRREGSRMERKGDWQVTREEMEKKKT